MTYDLAEVKAAVSETTTCGMPWWPKHTEPTPIRYAFLPADRFAGTRDENFCRNEVEGAIYVDWRGGDQWAILAGHGSLSPPVWAEPAQRWVWEPPRPSEWSDEFVAATRFPRTTALAIARVLANPEKWSFIVYPRVDSIIKPPADAPPDFMTWLEVGVEIVAFWLRWWWGDSDQDLQPLFDLVAWPKLEGSRSQPKRKRRAITDDLLAQVAAIYRAAESNPTQAVADALACSHRSAARYVQGARQRNLLPETTRGKVAR